VSQYQKGKTNLDLPEQEIRVASAGPYANLHFTPELLVKINDHAIMSFIKETGQCLLFQICNTSTILIFHFILRSLSTLDF